MRVNCADCGKFMGEVTIEGKLRTGYSSLSVYVLCADCHEPEGAERRPAGDVPDFLKDLFRGKL